MRASLLLLVACSCVTLPHVTPADVERAQSVWPGAELPTLEAARSTYVTRCSGCHWLYLPTARAPRQWSVLLPKMALRAKLSANDRDAIERFLMVMSQRPAN